MKITVRNGIEWLRDNTEESQQIQFLVFGWMKGNVFESNSLAIYCIYLDDLSSTFSVTTYDLNWCINVVVVVVVLLVFDQFNEPPLIPVLCYWTMNIGLKTTSELVYRIKQSMVNVYPNQQSRQMLSYSF